MMRDNIGDQMSASIMILASYYYGLTYQRILLQCLNYFPRFNTEPSPLYLVISTSEEFNRSICSIVSEVPWPVESLATGLTEWIRDKTLCRLVRSLKIS